jgi:four helix bundle protein
MARSYRDLEVYQVSIALFYRTHQLSLRLPKYELFELGSQIRRSSDSINSNIVEGYGRKEYKKDFLRFLAIARSSHDETINHLVKICKLYPNLSEEGRSLILEYQTLGKRLYSFHQYVLKNWRS